MKKKIVGIFLGGFYILMFVSPFVSLAKENTAGDNGDTDMGIEFKDETVSSSSSKTDTEPLMPPNKPIIQSKGELPVTGELIRPLILIFLGWMIVTVAVAVYLTVKKNPKNGKEGKR